MFVHNAMDTSPINHRIDLITLSSLGATIQSIGLQNWMGTLAFGAVTLYALGRNALQIENNNTAILLAGAAGIFTLQSGINTYEIMAQNGTNMPFWREFSETFGGISGVAGDIAMRTHHHFRHTVGGVRGAITTTLHNPGFWYSLCSLGFGLSALLANPSREVVCLMGAVVVCSAIAITISTKKLLQASLGIITADSINDGASNLWSARAMPLLTSTFIMGAIHDPWLYIGAVGSGLLGIKEYLLAKRYNPNLRFYNLITPPISYTR